MWTDTQHYKHSGYHWSSWPFQGMRDRKLQGTQDSFIHLIIHLLKKYSLSTLSYQTLWSKECPLGNSSIGTYPTTEHTCPNHVPLLPPTPLLLDSRTSLAPVFLYLRSFFGHQSPLCSPHDGWRCFLCPHPRSNFLNQWQTRVNALKNSVILSSKIENRMWQYCNPNALLVGM